MAISTVGKQSPIKLDMLDKRLLYELSQNYRIPRKELARKYRTSVQVLAYKIDRLLKNNIISPTIILTYPRLGISSYLILIDQLDSDSVKSIEQCKSVSYFFECVGRYQHIILINTDNIQEFCSKYLPKSHAEIHPITNMIADDYDPFKLGGAKAVKQNIDVTLDKKDYLLLLALCKNPAASLLSLKEKTGLDWQTVKSRMEKMESSNIIQKIRFALNTYATGFLVYYLKIDLLAKERVMAINFVRENCYSGFIHETLTGIFMYYMPPSHRELLEFTRQLAQSFDVKIDVIQVTDALIVEPTPKSVIDRFEKMSM